jgi:hypothetical protein
LDDLVIPANQACPRCGGNLRPWGSGRWRVVRHSDGDWGYRPGRVRCRACGVTQVVLPPDVLLRRRDAVVKIAEAWRFCAAGAGARQVSRLVGIPLETVRGWLRRLRARVEIIYAGSDGDQRQHLAEVLIFVEAAAHRAGWVTESDIWRFVSYRSQGRLLCNTSWP